MSEWTMMSDHSEPHYHLMSRRSFGWLIVAQVLAVIPHILDLPWWILVVSSIALAWRAAIFFERASWPRPWFVSSLGVFMVMMVAMQYRFVLSTESAVCGLVVLSQLKWLELRTERDVRILSTLLYALLAVSLLFDNALFRSLYVLFSLYIVVAAQVAQNDDIKPAQVNRIASGMVLMAIPLTVIMFVFFPRLSPFWGFMTQVNSGRMGMSSTMAPGNISKLTRSDEIAFQVEFSSDSTIPPTTELYWRSVVLENFDGREWTHAPSIAESWRRHRPMPAWASAIRFRGKPIHYQVAVQPHGDRWMFALDVPYIRSDGIELTALREVRTLKNVDDKQIFQMESYPDAKLDSLLIMTVSTDEFAMPDNRNIKSQALAKKMFEESQGDVTLFMKALLNYFREQPFYYTLEPPLLGYNAVDDFMFDSRRGFCEHYASAFAAMLRNVGVPARIVLGYQGGEINRFGKFITVRQYDAHAWTEVWVNEKGWVRVDPTAAVAPDRINLGMAASVRASDSIEAGIMHPAHLWNVSGLNWFRNYMDFINHKWTVWVVGYDGERQSELLNRLLGGADWKKLFFMALVIVAVMVLLTFLPAMWQAWLARERNPLMRKYSQLCNRLKRYRITRSPGESLGHFRERVHQYDAVPLPLRTEFVTHSQVVERHLYEGPR